ncbi:hypothetical protein K438DRAFT_1983981 [Mycena galopus ATCC 62051]|nr:hypothetical protein K438DRAFT_1983981 [Mycena galopus ATCC 62051]
MEIGSVFLRVGRNGRWGRYGGSSGGARCLVHGVVPWNTHDRVLGDLRCANAFEDALSWTILCACALLPLRVHVHVPHFNELASLWQVAYLLVLETLKTGFDMQMIYQPLILQYGHVLDYIFFSPRRVLAIVARLAPHPRPRATTRPFPRSWIQN